MSFKSLVKPVAVVGIIAGMSFCSLEKVAAETVVQASPMQTVQVLAESTEKKAVNDTALAAVKLSGKWGFVNRQGEVVIPVEHQEITVFEDGIIGVKKDSK